jgi:hypothetical protein
VHDAIRRAETVIFETSSHFFLVDEAEKSLATLSDWLHRHAPRLSTAAEG